MPNPYLPGVIQIPSMLLITGITRSYPMIVTFTVPSTSSNTYVVNQLVRLTIPRTWGMHQANGLVGHIMDVDSTTMQLDIDSNYFDAFVDGSATSVTPASLSPSGSRNLEFNNTSRQVPFQSLNNRGN